MARCNITELRKSRVWYFSRYFVTERFLHIVAKIISTVHSMSSAETHRLYMIYYRQVDFKISTLVYRSLAGTAPVYLADECTLVTVAGRRHLRSADDRTCLVKRSCNQFGDRCFATAGPTLWNSLPEQLRQLDITLAQFKRSLKTFMFG